MKNKKLKSCFRLLKRFPIYLIAFSLLMPSCQKPKGKELSKSESGLMSESVTTGIKFSDIMAKLPQTVMFSIGDSTKFYTGKYESFITDSTLTVRIPTTLYGNYYIYATRYFQDPNNLRIYLVEYLPSEGSTSNSFSGKQIWLDLQDWHFYGINYENNIANQWLNPIQLAEPDWENCMIENGYFSLDDNGKLIVSDTPTAMRGHGPFDCGGASNNGGGKNWFSRLVDAIGEAIGGIWGNGTSSNGGGSGGGGGVGSGFSDGSWSTGNGYGGPGGPNAGGGYFYENGWVPNGTIENGPAFLGENGSGISGGIGTAAQFVVNFQIQQSVPLNQNEVNWLVFHINESLQIQQYILTPAPNISLQQKASIIKEHIAMMVVNIDYRSFVNNYSQNNTGMWWMNENWLNNPTNNFQLAPNSAYSQFEALTAEEKKLVKIFPTQAYIISKNKNIAFQYAQSSGFTQPHNGKQDAFRHCFFQAINTRDVSGRYWGFPTYSSDQIVKLFSDAHESETPPQLQLEKEMDLFNNNIGINLGVLHSSFNNNDMASDISTKIANGVLKYLKPLDVNENIIPGQTQIYFTNQ